MIATILGLNRSLHVCIYLFIFLFSYYFYIVPVYADKINIIMILNLSTYGGALVDPEYVRMVAPQFGPRKTVAKAKKNLLP